MPGDINTHLLPSGDILGEYAVCNYRAARTHQQLMLSEPIIQFATGLQARFWSILVDIRCTRKPRNNESFTQESIIDVIGASEQAKPNQAMRLDSLMFAEGIEQHIDHYNFCWI